MLSALAYMQKHLAPWADSKLADIQRATGLLVTDEEGSKKIKHYAVRLYLFPSSEQQGLTAVENSRCTTRTDGGSFPSASERPSWTSTPSPLPLHFPPPSPLASPPSSSQCALPRASPTPPPSSMSSRPRQSHPTATAPLPGLPPRTVPAALPSEATLPPSRRPTPSSTPSPQMNLHSHLPALLALLRIPPRRLRPRRPRCIIARARAATRLCTPSRRLYRARRTPTRLSSAASLGG